MLLTPFLTNIDPRSAVRGSRDPLGQQTIWSAFGRSLVGNLSTVSISVRDFTIALLGFHFIERAEESGYQGSALDLFIRWEQLASYARAHILGEASFRGTDRVHRNLDDDGKVTLSAERAHQILGSQKVYGIWGLYTVPSRTSGLLEFDRPRLTAAARAHGEQSWGPLLQRAGLRGGEVIVDLLKRPSTRLFFEGHHLELLEGVAALIGPRLRKTEREFYDMHLVQGGPRDSTRGLQAQLADLLQKRGLPLDHGLAPRFLSALVKDARAAHGRDSELAERLERIRTLEPLLAVSAALFAWLQGQEGRDLREVARDLRKEWGPGLSHLDAAGVRTIEPLLESATLGDMGSSALRWVEVARALSTGAYSDAVVLLLEQNAHVMRVRDKSAPWVERGRDDRVRVRFRDERAHLPLRETLDEFWRYTYFIDALRRVVHTVRGGAS